MLLFRLTFRVTAVTFFLPTPPVARRPGAEWPVERRAPESREAPIPCPVTVVRRAGSERTNVYIEGSMKFVLVRTYSAGVHFGRLVKRNGKEVVLRGARRVWYWKGANTLNELVAKGPATGSKISEPTDRIVLTEAIEIIDMTTEQHSQLAAGAWK